MKEFKTAMRRAGQAARAGTSRIGRATGRAGWLKTAALGLGGIALLGALGLGIAYASLPGLDEMEARAGNRLLFSDASGAPLLTGNAGPSDYAALERMPEHLPQAVIAIEDSRFRNHGGIDLRAVSRAALANLTAGGIVQGGSTLTQQLVKNRFLDPERTFARKLHEAKIAREVEARWSKDEILEQYLNTIYLGGGAHGVAAAARIHFGRPVEELTLAESAAIAAMIQAPSAVNPSADPEALRSRAALVLARMEAERFITAGEANAARLGVAALESRRAAPAYGGWFAAWAGKQASKISNQFSGDTTLRTTLDAALQVRAEAAVEEELAGTSMEAAVVVLRADGTVAAMVGGRDYRTSQFNRAVQAVRQPGSTFKTFVFLTALADGMSPDDTISDDPVEIDGYKPENFSGRHHGEVTLREAFAGSYNAAAVRLAQQLGIERVIETARLLGVEAELEPGPALALGASGVPLIDMTEAYAAIATGQPGLKARAFTGLTTEDDGRFYPFEWPSPDVSPEAARLMEQREAMAGLLRAAVEGGTGEAAGAVPGAVGKTGTSQENRDALFIGWAGDMIAGVWIGNDDDEPMDGVTGGGAPTRIWARVMGAALEASKRDMAIGEEPEPEAETTADVPASATEPPEPRPENVAAPAPEAQPAPAGGTLRELDTKEVRKLLKKAEKGDVRGLIQQLGGGGGGRSCNLRACERAYRSFRASDCTFQPYGGGPRELCTR